MVTIHESNSIECPNCNEYLSAFDFNWLIQEAIDNDDVQSVVDEKCPHCQYSLALNAIAYTTAEISIMTEQQIRLLNANKDGGYAKN